MKKAILSILTLCVVFAVLLVSQAAAQVGATLWSEDFNGYIPYDPCDPCELVTQDSTWTIVDANSVRVVDSFPFTAADYGLNVRRLTPAGGGYVLGYAIKDLSSEISATDSGVLSYTFDCFNYFPPDTWRVQEAGYRVLDSMDNMIAYLLLRNYSAGIYKLNDVDIPGDKWNNGQNHYRMIMDFDTQTVDLYINYESIARVSVPIYPKPPSDSIADEPGWSIAQGGAGSFTAAITGDDYLQLAGSYPKSANYWDVVTRDVSELQLAGDTLTYSVDVGNNLVAGQYRGKRVAWGIVDATGDPLVQVEMLDFNSDLKFNGTTYSGLLSSSMLTYAFQLDFTADTVQLTRNGTVIATESLMGGDRTIANVQGLMFKTGGYFPSTTRTAVLSADNLVLNQGGTEIWSENFNENGLFTAADVAKLQFDAGFYFSNYTTGVSNYVDNLVIEDARDFACPDGDLNDDCYVDLFDFSIIAANWMEESVDPNAP